ncbi:MAG TPA: hypothetical protein VG248_19590 [Caulobacteraceae bacterium]|jgi:hypothetical protein|nr:hypothetical protein [Caulobacteraceae bacterium]
MRSLRAEAELRFAGLCASLCVATAPAAGVRAAPEQAVSHAILRAYAAAQALQGDLDGAWQVRDRRGHLVLTLQLADPPQHVAPPTGAWSAPDGQIGPIDTIASAKGRLRLGLGGGEAGASLVLRRDHARWTGVFRSGAGPLAVALSRVASARPAD